VITQFIFAAPLWAALGLFVWWFAVNIRGGADPLAEFADFYVRSITLIVFIAIARQLFCLLGVWPWLSAAPAAAAAVWAVGMNRPIARPVRTIFPAETNRRNGWLLLAMAAVINLPVLWHVGHNGFAASPGFFLYVDQPWHFSHALALMDGWPPKDLSFAGSHMSYHYGYALVAVVFAKAFFLSPAAAYYVVANVFGHLWILGGFLLTLLAADNNTQTKSHAALALAFAAFVLYFDVDWGLVLYWLALMRDTSALPGYEPYLQPQLLMSNGLTGAELLVMSLIVTVIGLIARGRYYLAAPLLGYISFVRPQGFIAFSVAYALFAAWRLIAKKEWTPALAGFVALAVTLFFQSFGMGRLEDFKMTLGWGYGFEYFARVSVFVTWVWSVVGAPVEGVFKAAGIFVSIVLRLLSLFMIAAPAAYLLGRIFNGRTDEAARAVTPYSYAALTVVLLYFFPFVITFEASGNLNAVYEKFIGIPYDVNAARSGYTYHSLYLGESLLVFLGAAILYRTYDDYGPRLKTLAVACVALTAAMYTLGYLRPPSYYGEAVRVTEIKEALGHAPRDAIIFTNQNAHPAQNSKRKYRNVLYPALFGQQFYASNFVYNNLHTKSDRQRLEEVQWFWSRPFDEENVRYLKDHNIGYLFINDGFPHNIPDDIGRYGLSLVAASHGYRLLKVN